MPYSNNQTHSPLSHGEGSGERPTFLELVAQDLHSKIGNDLSRVAIVFPNKRASLFSMNTWLRNPIALSGRPHISVSANCFNNYPYRN